MCECHTAGEPPFPWQYEDDFFRPEVSGRASGLS